MLWRFPFHSKLVLGLARLGCLVLMPEARHAMVPKVRAGRALAALRGGGAGRRRRPAHVCTTRRPHSIRLPSTRLSVLVGTRTVRGELDRVGFPALSRPVPIRPVQRPAVMERPEIVILFGLARRTARKSRKYHYFTHRRAAARRTPPRSRFHGRAARSRSPTRPRSGCHASPCRRGRRASGESRRRT